MKDKGNRIGWADTARGIAMLCVILGHMGVSKYMVYIIFSFHMPVFFLLGGYFLKPGDNKSFIIKKAKHLLIPYVFTSVCIIFLSQLPYLTGLVLNIEYILPDKDTLINQVLACLLGSGTRTDFLWFRSETFVGAIWFLLALFFAQIIVNFAIQSHISYIFVYVLAVLGIISARFFWLPFSIQSGAAASVFVVIGYKLSGKDIGKIVDNKRNLLICILLWAAYICLCFKFNKFLNIVTAAFPFRLLDVICPTAASAVIVWISYKLVPAIPKLNTFLNWFGKNSLVVLCFHLIEMKGIPFNDMIGFYFGSSGSENQFVQKVFIYTFKIAWACGAIFLVKRIKLLRRIFGYPDIKQEKALQG